MDLKVDKEKDISCDEVKPSDQTEEIGENTELRSLEIEDESHGKEESVEVKSNETVKEEKNEEKQHESVIDVPSRASENLKDNELETVSVAERDIPDRFEDNPSNLVLEVDKEELKDDKKYEDKVDETQNVEEKRGLDLNEQEAEQIDRNRTKETEETRTIIDAKIKEETQEEEVALHHEGQEKSSDELEIREETLLVPESCPPKEMKLEKELIEKHELDNDQQIPLVEKSDEVIKVSSASASEEREGGIVLDTEKIEVIKANEEQKVAESHSSLPSTVSEKIEEEKVNEESPIVQTREVETSLTDKCSLDQIQEEEQANDEKENVNPETEKGEDETTTVRDMSQGEAVDTLTVHDSAIFKTLETTIHEPEAVDSPIGGEEQKSQVTKDDNKPSLELKEDKEPEETETSKTVILSDEVRSSEVQAEEVPEDDHQGENTEPLEITKNFDDAEKISSEVTGDRQKEEDVQVKESPKVIETPPTLQEENIESNVPKDTETLATEPEALDTSIVQEAPILKTLETTNNETETKEDTEPSLDLEVDKENSISSDEVKPSDHVDDQAGESTELGSLEIEEESQEREESVEVKPEEKDDNLESAEKMQKPSLESSLEVSEEETRRTVDEKIEKEVTFNQEIQEENTISVAESIELTKENAEKHESTGEEDTTKAHQTHVEVKGDEAIQVSSAPPSEQLESETVVEAEKIERSLETAETIEPPKEQVRSSEVEVEEFGEHCSSETNDESHGRKESVKVKSEEIVQADKDDNLLDVLNGESAENIEKPSIESSLEVSEETSKTIDEKPVEEVTLHQESEEEKKISESSSPIEEENETKLQKENVVEKHTSTDEEDTNAHQIHVEKKTDEAVQISSAKISEEQEGKTVAETKKVEDKEEQVAEKIQRNLVEETKKEDDNKTVGIDGSGTSKTTENVVSLEALKLEESNKDKIQEVPETAIKSIEATDDHSLAVETSEEHHTPAFISDLEEKIPKQIDEIHEEETNQAQVVVDQSLPVKTLQEDLTQNEEETKESHNVESTSDKNLPVETSQAHQTPSSETVSETMAHKLQEEEILPTESSEPAASMEYNQVTVEEGNFAGETQEKRHVSAETEENVGETVLPETEVERTAKTDDQIETSTEVTKVEDEDTRKENLEKAEITKEEKMLHSSESACLKQEDLKDLDKLKHDSIIEDQDSLMDDDFTFPKGTGEAENGDETSSTLPVVGILKELHTTLENERAIKDSASSGGKTDDAEAESNGKDLQSIKAEEETIEIAEGKKEIQVDQSPRELLVDEKILIPSSSLPIEELEHEKQEGGTVQEGANASIAEKISPQEEHPIDFETSKKEHETFKDEDQIFDIKEEKKNEEVQDEKLEDLSITRDDKEDASELRLGHEFASVPDSMLEKEKDINEVDTSETPIDAEKEVKEEHVHPQLISVNTESNDERDFSAEESLDKKLQVPSSEVRKEGELIQSHQSPIQVEVNKAQEEEPVNALITSENLQVQEQPKDFVQEKDIETVKTEPEDTIKHGLSVEMKNNASEQIDQEATKEIYPEKSKQTETETAIKQEMKEEEKKTTQECLSTDDAIEETKPEMQEIENLSSVSRTLDISKQKDEVPNQEEKEIADQVQKLDNLKTADEESEKTKNQVLEVKESEPARKSLSDIIQKVGKTNKTTEPHIEEEAKEEEEDVDGDEKASPDSLVMVEAKDTVIISKSQQKKPHGILSGVGSKVKHSISKVKKAFTGKSSHTTTKPVSPK